LISLILGALLGAVPGFHSNLLITLGIESSWLFPVAFGALFSSIIPSLLFAPSGEMFPLLLSVQQAAGEGKLQQAVLNYIGGALLGVCVFVLLSPFYGLLTYVQAPLKTAVPFVLVFLIGLSLVRSKRPFLSTLIFLASGIYGIVILNLPVETEKILGAHFGAMFGLAGVLKSKPAPPQDVKLPRPSFDFAGSLAGAFGGLMISLFPALTPAHAFSAVAILFGAASRSIFTAGSLASTSFLFSILSLRFFGKGRMAIVDAIGAVSLGPVLLYAVFCYLLVFLLSPFLVGLINRTKNLKALSASVLIAVILIFYGSTGFVPFFSLALGLVPYYTKTERVHLMGSLLLPTLIFYLR
jgi:TctA family transporter